MGVLFANAQAAHAAGVEGAGFEVFRLQGFMVKRAKAQSAWERAPLAMRARLASVAGSHEYAYRTWKEIPAFARERIKSEAWREAQSWLAVFRCGVFG